MGKIFCIMGKSSSGKDTIFKELKKDKNLNLKGIISYTTRPKRMTETNGVEYFFINEEKLKEYKHNNRIIECREYDTVDGKWYYCTMDDGQIDLSKQNYLIIITLEAYKNLKKKFGDNNIVPIYVTLDDGLRLKRAVEREMKQAEPNYEEVCRRFLADSADFSDDKLKTCNISKSYINYNLNECIDNIKNDIKKLI